jgi:tRNA threonylcarbamoyladenosine biosynthesis protein TsaE
MIVGTEDDMRAFGEKLAATLQIGDWVAISGPLGAGKTVLCSGILRGLGYCGEVSSPSYAIVHQYDFPEVSVAVAHADLYRLNDVAELEELGLAEERDFRVTLVEWAERYGLDYIVPSHHIAIKLLPDGSREIMMKMEKNDAKR